MGTLARVALSSIVSICTIAASPDLPASGGSNATLYFFFTPSALEAPAAARRAVSFVREHKGRVRLRLVLLLKDFNYLAKLRKKDRLYQAVKELQGLGKLDIPLYDEEGFKLAERWKIRSVPAFVLVHSGRAHVSSGASVKLEDLLGCKE